MLFTKIQKIKDEIFLYKFKDKEKVRQICEKIDFNSYKSYFENSDVNCWDIRNKIYYNAEKYLYVTMNNDSNSIDPIYPYCSCLPLYCLKNYEDLDDDFDNLEFADEINLPNKCQNKFKNYKISNSDNLDIGNNKFLKFMNISLEPMKYDYIKIHFLNLNQLPGYFFFIISQIQTTGETNIHTYFKLITKIDIMLLVSVFFNNCTNIKYNFNLYNYEKIFINNIKF